MHKYVSILSLCVLVWQRLRVSRTQPKDHSAQSITTDWAAGSFVCAALSRCRDVDEKTICLHLVH